MPAEGSRWIGPEGLEVEVLCVSEMIISLELVNAPLRPHDWAAMRNILLGDWEKMNLTAVKGSEIEELKELLKLCCAGPLRRRSVAAHKVVDFFEKALVDRRIHYLSAVMHKELHLALQAKLKEWKERECHCWPNDPVCSRCRAILKEIREEAF